MLIPIHWKIKAYVTRIFLMLQRLRHCAYQEYVQLVLKTPNTQNVNTYLYLMIVIFKALTEADFLGRFYSSFLKAFFPPPTTTV